MTKTTHTHRGHCQACGRLQAVDNTSGLVAKHGYTVDFGYFSGTCMASDEKPAEHSVALTHRMITTCNDEAIVSDAHVVELKAGREIPPTFERWNPEKVVTRRDRWGTHKSTGGYDTLGIDHATADERAQRIKGEISHHEQRAEGLRSHVMFLKREILPLLGKPLVSVAELNAPKPVAAAPVVDVKTAKVTGTFATKQARKDALDRLSRRYEKLHRELQNMYLALEHDEREIGERTKLYYGQHQLNHWRPAHAEAWVREFPQAAAVVAEINELVAAREAVKTAP